MPGKDNSSNKMTQSDAARVQSGQAKADNNMSSTGFAARAQSAGDKNANAANSSGGSGGGNGGSKSSSGGGQKK